MWFLFFVGVALAAPVVEERVEKKITQGLTVENFDGYLNLLGMFREMLPKDLMGTLDNLNMSEKGELVSFITDYFQGKIKKPESKGELVEMIKEKLPTVFDKIDKLNTTFYTKFNALKPETQTMLRSWRDKAVQVEGSTPAESSGKQLQLLRDFAMAIQTMNPETKEDLRAQFPTAVRLTEGLGFTVVTTIAMIFQKIAESLTPMATVAVAPAQECQIALD